MRTILRFSLQVGLGCLVMAALAGCQSQEVVEPGTQPADDGNSFVYRPMAEGFGYPADKQEIEGWIANGEIDQIRGHAWNIWAAMTAPSDQVFNGQTLPIWETWFSGTDVYVNGPLDPNTPRTFARQFEVPHQFTHPSLEQTGQDNPEEVTSFNKFSLEAAQFIWDNQYYLGTTLDALNNSWSSTTPIQDRTIKNFPNRAIATKPVFVLVKQNTQTVLPYWAGISPDTTSNQDAPTSDTWKQCVLVDTTGQLVPGTQQEVNCNGQTVSATVVSLNNFYNFQLTQEEIDNLSQNAAGEFQGAVAGDYAVFVAMHVTTREFDNWTWQTFWWSPNPDDATLPPYPPTAAQSPNPTYSNYPGGGAGRPNTVQSPWDNYIMCTAYSTVVPPQPATGGTNEGTFPIICFNPYLETNFSSKDISGVFSNGGINSNCMSCHSRAAWPGIKDAYVSNGYFGHDDQIFADNTQLDFSWNVTRARTSTPTP